MATFPYEVTVLRAERKGEFVRIEADGDGDGHRDDTILFYTEPSAPEPAVGDRLAVVFDDEPWTYTSVRLDGVELVSRIEPGRR